MFHLTWISSLFQKISIDCVYLFQSRLMKTLVMIKNNLTEWMKTCVLFNLKMETVAKFLWKNIICRFKCFESIVINEDFENKIITEKLLNRYRIRIKLISTYHVSINEIIKKKTSIVDKYLIKTDRRWNRTIISAFLYDIINWSNYRTQFHWCNVFLTFVWTWYDIVHWNKIFDLIHNKLKQDSKYWRPVSDASQII